MVDNDSYAFILLFKFFGIFQFFKSSLQFSPCSILDVILTLFELNDFLLRVIICLFVSLRAKLAEKVREELKKENEERRQYLKKEKTTKKGKSHWKIHRKSLANEKNAVTI